MENYEQPFWMKKLTHDSWDSVEWYLIKKDAINAGIERIRNTRNEEALCEIAKKSPNAPFREEAIRHLNYDNAIAKRTIVDLAYNDTVCSVAFAAIEQMRPPLLNMDVYEHFCERFACDYDKQLNIIEKLMGTEDAETIAEALSRYLTLAEGKERYSKFCNISDTVLRAAKLLKQLYKKTGCEAVRRYNGRYPLWHEDSGMVCHYDEVKYMTLEIDID